MRSTLKSRRGLRPAALFALLLAGAAVAVRSQSNPVNPIDIKVNVLDHTAYGSVIPNTTIKPETRTEKLDLLIQNTTRQSYANLLVRYCIFDQDIQNQKIAVALQHETPIALPAAAALILTSQVASISYTPNHTIATKPKPTKKGAPEAAKETPVKAAGKQFAGYGIQVVQTNLNLVIGQLFSSPDLTNQFNTAFKSAKKAP